MRLRSTFAQFKLTGVRKSPLDLSNSDIDVDVPYMGFSFDDALQLNWLEMGTPNRRSDSNLEHKPVDTPVNSLKLSDLLASAFKKLWKFGRKAVQIPSRSHR